MPGGEPDAPGDGGETEAAPAAAAPIATPTAPSSPPAAPRLGGAVGGRTPVDGSTSMAEKIDTSDAPPGVRIMAHRAADAIAAVHTVPPGVNSLRVEQDTSGRHGLYRSSGIGRPVEDTVSVSTRSPSGVMAGVHELGHYLDRRALGADVSELTNQAERGYDTGDTGGTGKGDAMRRFLDAARASATIRDGGRIGDQDAAYVEDWQSPAELWARAYAQFIAKRSGDKVLADQLAGERANDERREGPPQTWPDDDFDPLDEAIEDVLAEHGLMERSARPDRSDDESGDEPERDDTPDSIDDPDAVSTLEEMTPAELEDALEQAGDAGDVDRLTAVAEEMNRRQDQQGESDDEQVALYERLIARGTDDEQAVEQAFGVSIGEQRRERAISMLYETYGYVGGGFDRLSREAYKDYIRLQYDKAESEIGMAMLTERGWRAMGDPKRLFSGPSAFARKWASEELRQWFDRNGRMTYAEYRAQLLGDAGAARAARLDRIGEADYLQ